MSEAGPGMSAEGAVLMADYNRWMNGQLIAAAEQLPDEQLFADKGAFFGSVGGTLNHLIIGDLVWLRRFGSHPAGYPSLSVLNDYPQPATLSEVLYETLEELAVRRKRLDDCICDFASELQDHHGRQTLSYRTMAGDPQRKPFGFLLQHFFNHQTHHRGQLTTLLSQAGIDVGTTDLLVRIDDVS